MSEEVLFYQLMILVSVVVGALAFGRLALIVIAACWAVWTVDLVFTRWLYVLQFLVLAVACLVGLGLMASPGYAGMRRKTRRVLGGGLAVLLAVWAGATYFDRRPMDREPAAAAPSVPVTPVVREEIRSAPPPPHVLQLGIDEAVNAVERNYPVLNPSSPSYDQKVVDKVITRQRELMNKGQAPAAALLAAAEAVAGQRNEPSGVVYRCAGNVYQDFPCDQRR